MIDLLEELNMRALLLLSSLLFSACAPSLSDLIMQANSSGDWTAVSKKIDAKEARRAEPLECRSSFTLFCEVSLQGEDCACVLTDRLNNRQMTKDIRRGPARRH